MLQHEREEFEALVYLVENGSPLSELETPRTEYGSEDEEFDRDCLEALSASETGRGTPSSSLNGPLESCLPMAMSID